MLIYCLAALVVIILILIIYLNRGSPATSTFEEEQVKQDDPLYKKNLDQGQLVDALRHAGWKVTVAAAGPGYRESREQAKILYGDRIFNSEFYKNYPLFELDDEIDMPIWRSETQKIEGVLKPLQLQTLVNLNMHVLRKQLFDAGWRMHYSKLCKKCVNQLAILELDPDTTEALVEREYIENHKHLWTNGQKSIDKVLNVLELRDLVNI